MRAGWKATTFGELGRVFNGNSISEEKKRANYQGLNHGVPYIGTKDIGFDHAIQYDSGVSIPDDKSDGFKLAPVNAVLVCSEGGSAGRKIAQTNRAVFFGNKLFAICPTNLNSSRFIFYYCLSEDFIKQFKDAMAGLIGGVSLNKFKEINIILPTLAEQQRIVGILDEAIESIATAKANTEKNLQNAHALFESRLNSVFTQRSKGWTEKTLDDVCGQITDGKHGDCEAEEGSGYYFLSAKDVKRGTLNYENARQITRIDFEETHRRTNLEPGDILITNSGTIGRMAIAPSDDRTTRTTFQKSVAILKPKRKLIDSTFAFYCLSSGLSRFVSLSAGAAQKNLLLRDLRGYRFAIPECLAEQRSVAGKLHALSAESARLEAIYQKKGEELEALETSLLHQAFGGDL